MCRAEDIVCLRQCVPGPLHRPRHGRIVLGGSVGGDSVQRALQTIQTLPVNRQTNKHNSTGASTVNISCQVHLSRSSQARGPCSSITSSVSICEVQAPWNGVTGTMQIHSKDEQGHCWPALTTLPTHEESETVTRRVPVKKHVLPRGCTLAFSWLLHADKETTM